MPDAPPLGNVTEIRVTVHGDDDNPIATITDPARISAIVEFVDARRSSWSVPFDGVPIPAVSAKFYDGETYEGHFAAGQTFFETNRTCRFCARSASSAEVRRFLDLLQVDVRYLDRRYKGLEQKTQR